MKSRFLMLSGAVMAMLGMNAETLNLTTPNTSMVIDATQGQPLKILHYGVRLSDAEASALADGGHAAQDAYPAYGAYPENEAAIAAVHSDGNMSLDLEVKDVATTHASDGASVTTVTMADRVYPVEVKVNYKLWPQSEDVIETWTEITNVGEGKNGLTLTRYDSASLPVRRGDVWLSQLYGAWANEARVQERPVPEGMTVIKNKDGVRNSHTSHSEVMLSLDGKPRENDGRVIGAALCYPGNYEIRIDSDPSNHHRLFAGINPDASAYTLAKGESLTTPALALAYSDQGLSGVSRAFHHWGRNHRLAHGNQLRPILLNSWEGVYFDINEEGMASMMRDIADMGGELFVMDDGWFGNEIERNNDSTSLGDWVVDTKKLPHGIKGLTDEAKKNGIKFGIWIEPEMVNTRSKFFEKHPEYVINAPKRPLVEGRGGTQMVLDLGNPKVQDVVFEVVDTLLTQYPEIAYIKWDANAPIMSHGSGNLPADKQSHLYVDYHKGFAKVMDRIRAKYPDVLIQACASGGGRANWGVLPWFDEFWTSDNTDALQRIYMQWGTSYFFPAIAMGSHISAAPNHQTFRTIPLKYRADVAMSGRLGLEIQPKNMTAEEKEQARRAIADYKQVRPTVQHGDLYRLLSPYDGKGLASMMYVNPAKDEAVFYWWKTETFVGHQLPRIRMAGLEPDRMYTVTELNRYADEEPLKFEGKQFSGRFLMENGLEIPTDHNLPWGKKIDYASRVLRLTGN